MDLRICLILFDDGYDNFILRATDGLMPAGFGGYNHSDSYSHYKYKYK